MSDRILYTNDRISVETQYKQNTDMLKVFTFEQKKKKKKMFVHCYTLNTKYL